MRIKENQFIDMETDRYMCSVVISLILLGLVGSAVVASAQQWQRTTHHGVEASTGVNAFAYEYNGNTTELRAMSIGAAAGVVLGNSLVRGRASLGVYAPTEFSDFSGRILESGLLVNFYPLEFMRTRDNILDVYVTTGVKLSNVRLVGVSSNYKSESRLLAQVLGIGGEVVVASRRKFIYVFSEVLFSNPINAANLAEYQTTWEKKYAVVNVGVRFGILTASRYINRRLKNDDRRITATAGGRPRIVGPKSSI